MKISHVIWLIFLLTVSWQDIRRKEISTGFLILMGILGTGIQFFEGTVSLRSWFGGIGLGIALLILGAATRENIGYGDGWLVLVMGMSLGFRLTLMSLLFALGISALVSGALLVSRKVKRTDRIPFAPFLMTGCLLSLISLGG